ncbi:Na+:H+ antiporter, NhaC family [Dethiosulfatibacter aminovorans DSM 17477]|uniref:Na+:H+ antiporter, NhaC family n=1 Tax=Dethiosulfatibacter aminovorans DSM 17477 TaxID=1121476 RepID=A0A1M6B344_9FIRM|nr:Na+/H+ antiporter NhaC [Dethiosulfatibacter aminovorans]SHI42883.1 Na+:H+ antiporter, NhaC family [Dethiosulfatibacter aminovorans DSM 17477]
MGKKITFGWSMVPVLFLVAALILTLRFFNGAPHIALFFSAVAAAMVAMKFGYKWQYLEKGIVSMLSNTLPSMLIFCIIGMVIGVWMLAGVVPTMIYYGLMIVSPKYFLFTSCLICCIVSLSTGSSWTTVGTVGIALIGMGHGLGVPLPMVAGAIVSGAYFGDKMSPLSDTTNLAPASAGCGLFEHISHMLYTSGPSIVIALIMFFAMGMKYGSTQVDSSAVDALLLDINGAFVITPVLLLPPVLIIIIVIKKIPAIPGLASGVLLGAVFAYFVQGKGMTDIIAAMHYGFLANTGNEVLDELLTRGGLDAMMWPLSLVFMSLSFAGVMERSGMVQAIADVILSMAKSTGAMILSTVLTCIGVNVLTGDQYLSIVFTGEMYKKAYRDKGLHAKNLSRTLEDSGTLSSPMIPWNACAVFMASTLGVPTAAYVPFAFFNLINPVIAVIYGYTGITIAKAEPAEERAMDIK